MDKPVCCFQILFFVVVSLFLQAAGNSELIGVLFCPLREGGAVKPKHLKSDLTVSFSLVWPV